MSKNTDSKKIPVLITTDKDKRGVFMGYINPDDAQNTVLEASDIRMCVRWDRETHGVLGLAANGPGKGCRVSPGAPLGMIHGVTAVCHITEKAEKAWIAEPWAN